MRLAGAASPEAETVCVVRLSMGEVGLADRDNMGGNGEGWGAGGGYGLLLEHGAWSLPEIPNGDREDANELRC